MKKKYEALEIELIRVDNSDVITSSPGTEGPIVPDDSKPEGAFPGSYDSNGWT